MKKSQITFVVICVLLITGISLLTFLQRNKHTDEVFPAIVNRDCAPWDGSAFTMTIQYDEDTELYISIWKAPNIKFPSTFVLPDDKGQVGHAYILPALGPYVVLNGEVSVQNVSVDKPIEGRFSFTSDRGEVFKGRFIAEWGNEIIMCG
jgi:hypothetical protein